MHMHGLRLKNRQTNKQINKIRQGQVRYRDIFFSLFAPQIKNIPAGVETVLLQYIIIKVDQFKPEMLYGIPL